MHLKICLLQENHTGPQLQTPALILDITLLDDDLLCSGIAHFALL